MSPSSEVAVPVAEIVRLRQSHPGALSAETISGMQHLVRAEVTRMERRGEIVAYRQYARLDRRSGVLEVPFVRLRSRVSVRRRRTLTAAMMTVTALALLSFTAWLAWESRYVIMAGTAILAGVMLLLWLAPHWGRGCPGMHCRGCGG